MGTPFSFYTRSITDSGNFRILLNQIFLTIFVNLAVAYTMLFIYAGVIKNNIKTNIYEYNEVDLTYICAITDCKYIYSENTIYKANGHRPLTLQAVSDSITKIQIGDSLYLTQDWDLLLEMVIENYFVGYIILDKASILDIFETQIVVIVGFYILFNLLMLSYILHINFKSKYREENNRESELYYQSMVVISENLHHELNTPLAVVNSKAEKLFKLLNGVLESTTCNSDPDFRDDRRAPMMCRGLMDLKGNAKEIIRDYRMISTSLEQIEDILNRMKQFKTLRHHSKDISLYDAILATLDVLSVSQSEKFEYVIDEEFKNYKIDERYLKNGEFTGILINFVKNSLEAHALNLRLSINTYNNGNLSFFIGDDGNGIPPMYLNKVFEQNSSSKGSRRGNGLFINKFLLESTSGSIKLIHSSKDGTAFEITIKAVNA